MPHPIDRFAALAAHSLNGKGDGLVSIEPGAIYVLWVEALATRYAAPVLQHPGFAARMDADEAAERYFRATLERGLFQAAQSQCTVAHTLFLSLCRRGGPEWTDARLQRQPADASIATPLHLPAEWRAVAQRLAACDHGVSQSNAATSHRNRHGPLMLICGAAVTPVPEQMSIWDAVCCAPRKLAALAPGEAFNAFCSVFINALRTANRQYQEILSLGRGLCPFDWLDVPVNRVRAVGGFLDALERLGGGDEPASWERAWTLARVTGFPDSAAFRNSELGCALRAGPGRHVDYLDVVDLGQEDAAFQQLLEADAFAHAIAGLERQGLVSDGEADLLLRLYGGETFEQLATGCCFTGESDVETLIESLRQRIQRQVQTIPPAAAPVTGMQPRKASRQWP